MQEFLEFFDEWISFGFMYFMSILIFIISNRFKVAATRNRAAEHRDRGIDYSKNGDYDSAIEAFNEAIRIGQKYLWDSAEPKIALSYINRGYTYANMGDYNNAIKDFSEAIEHDPKNHTAYYNRGLAYANKHEYDLSIDDFNDAINLDPSGNTGKLARIERTKIRECFRQQNNL